MKNLYGKIGDAEFDGLITDITPKPVVRGAVLAALLAEATLKRGTILAKNAAGKLIVLGSDVDATGTFNATGDGSKKKFDLVSGGVIPSAITEVKVGGTATTAYTYNAAIGELEFTNAPANAASIAVKFSTGGGNAYAILCDDTVVGTSDVNAEVYFAGCFDPNKCTVATGYTLSDADKDTLRTNGILFKAAAAAN